MNSTEANQLLAHASAFDNRNPSAAAGKAWAAALHDVPLDADTLAAVARYYGTHDPDEPGKKWLQPHHVRTHRTAIRTARLGPVGPGLSPEIPAADPDDVPAYLAALRDQHGQAAAGQPVAAIEPGPGDYSDANPNVRNIRALFDAEQAAARARKEAERKAAYEATRAYIDAQEILLGLPDLGEALMEQAFDELFGPEQAAAGFPLAADAVGVDDRQKTTIRAAWLAREGTRA